MFDAPLKGHQKCWKCSITARQQTVISLLRISLQLKQSIPISFIHLCHIYGVFEMYYIDALILDSAHANTLRGTAFSMKIRTA